MCWCGSIRGITRSRSPRRKRIWRDAEAALESSRIDIPITATNTASQLKTANSCACGRHCVRCRAPSASWLPRRPAWNRRRPRFAKPRRTYKKASDDVARYKLLVDKNEIPRQQYDTAVSHAAAARRPRVDARKAAVHEAEQNIAVAQSAVDQANQRIPQADASIESADDRAQAGSRSAQARAKAASGAGGAEESAARPGQAESQLLHDRRAGQPGSSARRRWNWDRMFRPANS